MPAQRCGGGIARRRTSRLAGLLPALVISFAAPVPRLDAQPQPARQPEPTLVLSASVASVDQVGALAKEIGFGDVPFLSAGFVEEQLPFIGAGGLAADRPLGVLFYVGPEVDLENALTFVLPVRPGKAELKPFVEKGAKPVANRTDLVTLEGMGFHRTRDQFVFGQSASAVSAVREDALTAIYPADDAAAPLARVDFDIAAFRKAVPERYEAFFAEIAAGVEADDADEQAGAEFVQGVLRGITRLGLSLHRAEAGGLRLRVASAPFKPASTQPSAKFQSPGFPEAAIARLDLAFPPSRALASAAEQIVKLAERDEGFGDLTDQQQARVRALPERYVKLLFDGDAGSFAIEPDGESVVGYWVVRRGAEAAATIGRDMQALAKEVDDVAKLTKQPKPIASYESYKAGEPPVTVHRLLLLEDGEPALYIDARAAGDVVRMSFATTDGKFVERLAPLKPEGEMTTLAAGWFDLAAVTKLEAFGGGGGGAIDAEAFAEIRNALKGKRLNWTASADAGALQIDLLVPKDVLDELPKIFTLFR